MNIILLDDISRIIWKSYFSNYVIPIISSRKESKLYLQDDKPNTKSEFELNLPLSFWFSNNTSLAIPLIALSVNDHIFQFT